MRHAFSLGAVSLAAIACGSTSHVAPPPPSAPSVVLTSPASPVTAAPTERTPEERARDEDRAPLANTVVDAYENWSPKFSPDGRLVLFSSNRGGNREIYLSEVAHPEAEPLAVTQGPERAAGAVFARDGRSIFFLRDQGADENYRVYQVGLDGQSARCLTPGAVRRRSLPIEPRDVPGTLIYWERDPAAAATDVVVHPLSGQPTVVYTDRGVSSLQGVTHDGRRALLLRRYSSTEHVLFELDLSKGTTRRLYPLNEGTKVAIHAATYAADGKRAFVAADDGAAGQLLQAVDADTGIVRASYGQSDPKTAEVSAVTASPRGDRVAITVDAGDHGEARLLDATTLRVVAKIETPLGAVGLTSFTRDGARVGLSISTPDRPSDVFAVEAATATVVPLRREARPALDALPPIESSVTSAAAFDGRSIPLLVHRPSGSAVHGPRVPVIVAFHGGPSGSATMEWNPFARFFTALGYAYVEPNVRGSTGYGREYEMADDREKRADWLRDVAAVNAWARAQPWADRERIVAMGGSYGGYTVLMALTRQPELWRAGVDYVGISNLVTFMKTTTRWLRTVWVDEFGDLDRDRDLLERFSPLRDADRIRSPLYVYAGQNDPRVPREESDQIVTALRRSHVPVEYQVAPNEGHSLDHRENRLEFMTRVARFLDDHLR